MKVFAEYKEKDGLEYRMNTLLQFGESWELIGNIVLANPGSATPRKEKPNLDHIKDFFAKYRNEEIIHDHYWFEFTTDDTIRFIQTLFDGSYVNPKNKRELNGVIQLFNTFNIKNQSLKEAIKQIENADSDLLFTHNIAEFFHDKPTYFGFSGDVLKHKLLKGVAEEIFTKSSPKIKKNYNSDFSANANKFYHTGYLKWKNKIPQEYKKQFLEPLIQV